MLVYPKKRNVIAKTLLNILQFSLKMIANGKHNNSIDEYLCPDKSSSSKYIICKILAEGQKQRFFGPIFLQALSKHWRKRQISQSFSSLIL